MWFKSITRVVLFLMTVAFVIKFAQGQVDIGTYKEIYLVVLGAFFGSKIATNGEK